MIKKAEGMQITGLKTFHALPKLPPIIWLVPAKPGHGPLPMKTAAIWGGVLAARHACVVGCKLERYHNINAFRGGASVFFL